MFTAFKSGTETGDAAWDDSPNYYAPGRFHAHPRSPNPGSGANSPPIAHLRPQKRGVTRRPAQQFLDDSGEDANVNERSWLLRPGRQRVEGWLEAWWRRWAVLVGIPCLVVSSLSRRTRAFRVRERAGRANATNFARCAPQVWLAPVAFALAWRWVNEYPSAFTDGQFVRPRLVNLDLRSRNATLKAPVANARPCASSLNAEITVNNATASAKVGLNWWPTTLGGSVSYLVFWALPLLVGYLLHAFELDGFGTRRHRDAKPVLYLRNLSENVTMVAFLGWVFSSSRFALLPTKLTTLSRQLTILHFGPNKPLYPFFSFESDTDPYNYRLTAIASLIIWATELGSSFLARLVIWFAYKLDVTNIGLDHFREHPELVVACVWCSIHVLSDILLFLIKLNFR
ncbi:hypothetical protein P7C70_g1740, partial [Phenoliferia sp. Uapishka_3]